MGGREVGGLANLLSAHRDLANPAHRAEVAALWGVPDVPDKPGQDRGRDVRGRRRRRDQGAVDRLHEPGAVDARPGDGAARAASAPSSSSCRRPSRPPPPATTPTCCCRPRPGARRTAPSPTASAASAACAPAVPAPGRGARTTGRSRCDFARRLEARLRARRTRHALSLSPDAEVDLERAPRIARAAATSTSPA